MMGNPRRKANRYCFERGVRVIFPHLNVRENNEISKPQLNFKPKTKTNIKSVKQQKPKTKSVGPKPNRTIGRAIPPPSERPAKRKSPNLGKPGHNRNIPPRIRQLGNGNVVVCHREYLGKMLGSINFNVKSAPINPGYPASFGWLYRVALDYESYKILSMKYQFEPNQTGTFSGTVIMGIDYDPSDASPLSENELQTYWGCVTTCITEPCEYVADREALHKIGPEKFCRLGALAADQDIKLYDSGNFFYAVDGTADNTTVIGRIFCEYEIELCSPHTDEDRILSCNVAPEAETYLLPLGTSFVSTGSLAPVWITGTTFSIPVPGQYLLIWLVTTATTLTAVTKIASNTGQSSFGTIISDTINSAATRGVCGQVVKVNSFNDVFTVGVTAANATFANNLRIAPYEYANA